MNDDVTPDVIDTATRCSCGCAVSVLDDEAPAQARWTALCLDCYDGTDDAGERAHVLGRGPTVRDALWAWQDKHDEAHEVEWHLADLVGEIARQVSEEHDRQRGWVVKPGTPDRDYTHASPRIYGARIDGALT
jgi:hypothetical protein